MIFVRLALLGFPLLVSGNFIRSKPQSISAILASGLSPGASIHFPSDSDFANETTQRWSTFAPPTFLATIKPATDRDVQKIVKVANRFNIPFYATGGAHGAEPGFANVKNAINIDLSNFDTKILDAAANTFTVGPKVIFSEIYQMLYDAGKEMPVGNANCVSLIGATIGAGVGSLQGLHGLILDSLRSVRLITAAGKLVTASKTENSDLFWAVRGAGANFGIITEAVFEVYPATNNGQVINADFSFNPASNESLWEVLKTWDEDYPKQMGMTIGGSYNKTAKVATLGATVAFFGTQEQFQPHLDKLVALNPIRWRNISVPWPRLTSEAGFGGAARVCVRGSYASHHGISANRTDVETFASIYNDFINYHSTRDWYRGSIAIQRFGEKTALALPKADQGAYPWRDIRLLIEFNNFYDGPSHDNDVNAFCEVKREEFRAVSGFAKPQVYVNYAFGDEGPEVWYGPSLPRLRQLKQVWDPLNKFGKGNPLNP